MGRRSEQRREASLASNFNAWTLLCLTYVALLHGVSGDDMAKDRHTIPSLHRYQALHISHLEHSLSHGNADHPEHSREIKLNLFERDLHLHLVVHRSLFHDKFNAYEVDGKNRKRRMKINTAAFYHGVVHGDGRSQVVAHVSDKNLVSATIHTVDGVYSIEPSSRHIKVPHNFHMIAYRDSDIRSRPGAKACGLRPEDESTAGDFSYSSGIFDSVSTWVFGSQKRGNSSLRAELPKPESSDEQGRQRLKRQASSGGFACPVTLVADMLYAEAIGSGDFQTVASSMILQLSFADRLVFKTSPFSTGGSSPTYGMQVRDVIVFAEASNSSVPYNTGKRMEVRSLLRAMTYGDWNIAANGGMPGVCLAHLFTHQPFAGNVLGLAYVASPDRNSVGGICNIVFQQRRWLNVGLTTTMNCPSDGSCAQLVQRELNLVTAHELGHNWGSPHDSTTACISDAGGRYLMNQYALPGTEGNNVMLSSCSLASISAVLRSKADICLVPRQGSFCGNGVQEGTEQCDAGFNRNDDRCCSSVCRYRSTAFRCSDANDDCCQNCTFAPSTLLCQAESSNRSFSCVANSFCSGDTSKCVTQFQPTGASCGNFGQCQAMSGAQVIRGFGDERCRGFCESTLNEISCICPNIDEQCIVCCKKSVNGECRRVNQTMKIQDGAGCGRGFCVDGACRQADLDSTEQLFSFLSDFSADTIARWFRDNIVAAVLVCTFIAWVIGGLIVRHVDKKKMEKFNEEFDEYKDKLDEYLASQSVTPYTFNRRQSFINRNTRSSGADRGRGGQRATDCSPLMEESHMLNQ